MGSLTHTESGSVVSFRSAARTPIESLKCSFLPQQDLHGFSKPWPAGSGKNLLKNTRVIEEITTLGVTFTVNNDGSMKLNGTSTGNFGLTINKSVTLPSGNYILTGCPSDGSDNTFYLGCGGYHDYGNGVSFSLNEETTFAVRIQIVSGTVLNNLKFYPMIRLASNSDSTWEPYENNCPITGHGACVMWLSSKNLINTKEPYSLTNMKIENNAYTNTIVSNSSTTSYKIGLMTGSVRAGIVSIYTAIKVGRNDVSINIPSNVYVQLIDGIRIEIINGNNNFYICFPCKFHTIGNYTYSFTLEKNDLSQIGGYVIKDFQIESSSSVTDYEPHNGQTIIQSFPIVGKNKINLQSIVGRGNITAENGVVTATAQDLFDYVGTNAEDRFQVYIPANTTYTISVKAYTDGNATTSGNGFAIFTGHADNTGKTVILFPNNTTTSTYKTFTGTSSKDIVTFAFGFYQQGANIWHISELQLELGDTATTYEEYSSNNTVYGGYIDVAKGEVVSEWIYRPLNDSTKWLKNGNALYYTAPLPYARKTGSLTNLYCSFVPTAESLEQGTAYVKWASTTTTMASFPINGSSLTLDIVKELSANGKAIMCYELAEPIHHYFPPNQLKTLLDQNIIWSHTKMSQNDTKSNIDTTTEVSYALHDSAMIRAAKQRIIHNEPHLVTTTGGIASFNTDMKAPLKECKIYFNPVQAGSGDPSPDNVRAISGWNGITYFSKNRIIPVEPTSSQSVSFYGANINYIGNGVYNIEGTASGTGSVLIPINSITYQANTEYCIFVKLWPETDIGNNILNVALKTAGNSNCPLCRMANITNGYEKYYREYGENTTVVNIAVGITDSTVSNIKFQIIIFENVSTEQILDWSSTAGTIYGGYVDLVSGKLVQTHKYILLNDTNAWTETTRAFIYKNNLQFFSDREIGETNTHELLCSIAPSDVTKDFFCRWTSTQGYDFAFRWLSTNTSPPTLSDIQTLASNNNISIVYKLATPIIYQLTQQQLTTLRGHNNIWSNANGNIELAYWSH